MTERKSKADERALDDIQASTTSYDGLRLAKAREGPAPLRISGAGACGCFPASTAKTLNEAKARFRAAWEKAKT